MFCSIRSYKFLFVAQDDTAEAEFFAYDDTARNIIRRNVTAVINQQRKDPAFPQFLTEVISKKFTFAIIITDDSFGEMRARTYQVKSVLIDHEYQAHRLARQLTVDAPASASTQTPSVPTSMLQIQCATPQIPKDSVTDDVHATASLVCSPFSLFICCIISQLYIPIHILTLPGLLADTSADISI
jgi:hypothetical protein